MRIVEFTPSHEDAVIELISSIQRGEFGIEISVEDQPDLRAISSFYQVGSGNFWVALIEDRVVGTISLLDLGNGQGALRKMFVDPAHRGGGYGVARALLDALLAWAVDHDLVELHLGTTAHFHAAHRFYEKNGFREISKSDLPATFPIMEVDTKFYQLGISDRSVRSEVPDDP